MTSHLKRWKHNQVINFAPLAPDTACGRAGYERRYALLRSDSDSPG
jgi:hypothetical protein